MRSNKPITFEELGLPVKIAFDARVFEYIIREAKNHPDSEDGGKYIGKMRPIGQDGLSVLVSDFLPGGPRARRTSVEFFPDGEFQETMFRAIEGADPDVEHLGSWHTHHCNGLDRLSSGDIEGYFRTVSKRAYRPKVFIASLVKRIPPSPDAKGWIDHFLFVRGEDRFYDITKRIEVVESDSGYGRWTGHETQREALRSTGTFSRTAGSWFDSEVGRQTLAEDRRFLASSFSRVSSIRKNGQIKTHCEKVIGSMTVTYPAHSGESRLVIDVATGLQTVLTLQCDLGYRRAAFVAALAALECQ